jgi:hypothetical protein
MTTKLGAIQLAAYGENIRVLRALRLCKKPYKRYGQDYIQWLDCQEFLSPNDLNLDAGGGKKYNHILSISIGSLSKTFNLK